MVPTRELAAQIGEVAKEFGQYLQPRVKSGAVFGGVALNPQMIMVNNVELLGEGVAASTRFDPQGKALGEWLRARHLDVPEPLLHGDAAR